MSRIKHCITKCPKCAKTLITYWTGKHTCPKCGHKFQVV